MHKYFEMYSNIMVSDGRAEPALLECGQLVSLCREDAVDNHLLQHIIQVSVRMVFDRPVLLASLYCVPLMYLI